MHLLVPCSVKQLMDRASWFKSEEARQLAQEKQVEFGFELKGDPETITEAPPLFWGYHAPNFFASEWYYHPERRLDIIARLKHIEKLAPDYINFHGAHLWSEPGPKDSINRFKNQSEAEEYLKILDSNVHFLQAIKKIFPKTRVTMEIYPLNEVYVEDGEYLPITHLYTGAGRLLDLVQIKDQTGVEILTDIEHLIFTLNFLNRDENYKNVPIEKQENLTEIEKKAKDIYGFCIRKNTFPYVDKNVSFEDIVKKFDSKVFHLTGSTTEFVPGKRIDTHKPIKLDDQVFLNNLKIVLNQKPDALLIETADSTLHGYEWLRENELELSFYNLCKILMKEL